MDKSKSGGRSSLDLTTSALQRRRHDTLLRLQQAKRSGEVSKNILATPGVNQERCTVSVLSNEKLRGTARMLSSTELFDLRETKKLAAKRTLKVVSVGRK